MVILDMDDGKPLSIDVRQAMAYAAQPDLQQKV